MGDTKQELVNKLVEETELEELMEGLGMDYEYLWDIVQKELEKKTNSELIQMIK